MTSSTNLHIGQGGPAIPRESISLAIDFDGTINAEVLLDVQGQHLRSRITRDAFEELGLAPDQHVFALIKSVALESSLGP